MVRFCPVIILFTEEIEQLGGGGVLLAVKDHLLSKLQYSSDVIESIVIEIYSTRSFIVCILYTLPPANELNHTQVCEVLCSLPLNLDVRINTWRL